MTGILRACNETYERDPEGVWHYFWGPAVPGARDVTLHELMELEPTASTRLLLERFRPLGEAERRWLNGEPVAVDDLLVRRRGSRPPHAGDLIVSLQAPELNVVMMLTVSDIAEDAGVSKATIDSYRYRGDLPQPQVTCGRTPLWTRPVVSHWLSTRPGCGWRTDVHGEPALATAAAGRRSDP